MVDKDTERFVESEAKTALQKNKEKVIEVLTNEPFGLTFSQIMSICKISAKTAKNILACIDVSLDGGVYKMVKNDRLDGVKAVAVKDDGILNILKSKIIVRTVTTKEVFLTKEELSKLLSEQFGLKFVEFFEDGSVHLQEVVSQA